MHHQYLKCGNRLVTESDYRTFILNKFKDRVYDVYVCNNAEYTTSFYGWLKEYNKLSLDIRKNYYRYADACDFNNVYLWIKPTYSGSPTDSDLNEITDACNKIKMLTAEIVPCSVLEAYFIPYVQHPDYTLNIENLVLSKDWQPPVKLMIHKKQNALISNEQLKEKVNKIFIDYFALENQKLGNIINIGEIYQSILDTGFVEKIKTRYIPTDDPDNIFEINGLSMACYTPTLLDGLDFEVFQHNKKLQMFQFPIFYAEGVMNLLEIANEEDYNITRVRF